MFPAMDYPEVMKRGFGMKSRQHKHDDELHAQAQLNSMPRVAFQVKKKGRPPVKIGKGIDVAIIIRDPNMLISLRTETKKNI